MNGESCKRGFTLVELMIVVGIIGVLMAVLLGVFSGATESARAARCLGNLKALANGVQSYGMASGAYPKAGCCLQYSFVGNGSTRNRKKEYTEQRSWICSWDSRGGHFPSSSSSAPELISMFEEDDEKVMHAFTNGVLWRYVSANTTCFLCPSHRNLQPKANWSYVMNAFFGWNADENYAYAASTGVYPYHGSISRLDKVLLFAEVPFQGPGDFKVDAASTDTDADCVLQFDGCDQGSAAIKGTARRNGHENIGACHKAGNFWVAHVVFCDGHTEKLRAGPTDKEREMSGDDLKHLTTWLCRGYDVAIKGNRYENLTE